MQRPSLPSPLKCALFVAAFIAVSFAVYGSSMGHQFVTWDDMGLIRENPDVQSMTPRTVGNVFSSYDPELYIPLTFVSYQIDWLVGGGRPAVFIATNILLHGLNAALVTALLFLLLGNGLIAVLLGLLFALHPLNTEAVVWMSARKDTLSTLFFLLSLNSYLLADGTRRKGWYGFSLVAFVLGLLSKVMIVTLPVVLLLLDLLRGRRIDRAALVEKIPYLVCAVIFGVVALFGKSQVLDSSTLTQKILMAGRSTVFYLQKFFVPSDLSVMVPYGGTIEFSVGFVLSMVCVITLLVTTAMFWRQKRGVSVGILLFFVTLVPTFTNVAKGGEFYVASDRYAYIPMIGLLLALGCAASDWLGASSGVRAYAARRNTLVLAASVLLPLLAWRSSVQASAWADSETLYLSVLRSYPKAQAARNNLGMEYLSRGRSADALREFDLALQIRPDPRTRANRAAALVQQGRLDEAQREYEDLLRSDPGLVEALYGRGVIEQRRGRMRDAVGFYERALAEDSGYVNALNNLGAAFLQLEEWDRAIETLRLSIERRPDFVESYYNLAGAYERKGMTTEAEAAYLKALDLYPSDPDALANLASLVYGRGDIDGAAKLLMEALEIQGDNPVARALVERMKRDGVAE